MELHLGFDSKRFIKKLFFIILAAEIGFVILDIFMNYLALIPEGSIQRLFNIAREDSLPAWVAGVQTLFVGLVLWLIYLKNRNKGWAVIAAFFTYLGIDDGSKLHERIGTAVKHLAQSRMPAAAESVVETSYTWQFVFGPAFVAMGFFILWFMWRELKQPALRWLVFAALACYGTAVGLDFIEGMPGAYEMIGEAVGLSGKFTNHFGRVIEEFLELLGSTLFLVTFLWHFMHIAPKTVVTFHDDSSTL